MKRGLKVGKLPGRLRFPFLGYNLYPDEKGTERVYKGGNTWHYLVVTTYTPIKRGLKETFIPVRTYAVECSKPCSSAIYRRSTQYPTPDKSGFS